LHPPDQADCEARAGTIKRAVPGILALAVGSGQLVAVATNFWLHAAVEGQARSVVAAAMAENGSLTVSQIRELLGTTRKYAVPLCEYWDKIGFTERRGDQRVLRSA
jgi:selenocysteine-specific elongation factor